MDKRPERSKQLLRDRQANGLLFGLIAGFWFGAGIWAFDWALLARANAELPWLKFAIGAPILILIGGGAGWLTARLDSSIVGAFAWLLAGIVFVWVASHTPFEGQSLVIGWLDQHFSGMEIYPFVESVRIRMILLYIVVGVFTAIGGSLELFFVESAMRASSQAGRFTTLLACLIIFAPIGLAVDNLINQSLRNPIVGLDNLIRFGVKTQQGLTSIEDQREQGVRALKVLGDRITNPYRLILGSYDPESLDDTIVHADFSGEWGACSVLLSRPMTCRLSSERYLKKLDCLIEKGEPLSCGLRQDSEGQVPPADVFSGLDASPLKFGILGQRGLVVLAVAEDQDGDQVQCVFRDTGDVYLDSCFPSSGANFDLMPLPPTPTKPAPVPTLIPIPPVETTPEAVLADPGVDVATNLQTAPQYTLSLVLADDLRSFTGDAAVTITNNELETLNALYFHLLPNGKGSYGDGSLTATRTTLAGQEVATELSVRDTVLKIPLSPALEPGEVVEVGFEFSGEVPLDFGGEDTPAGYGIYNYSDGVLAISAWYPMLAVFDEQGWNLDLPSEIGDSVYSDMAIYSVQASLPAGLIIASTSSLASEDAENGRALVRFETGPAREFFLAASADFKVASQEVGDTTVHSYYLKGSEAGGEKALATAADSLRTFNELFGAYPYSEFDVVMAPMRYALGVEFPGIVLITADLYEDPGKSNFQITVAHEAAHQWWYGVVGNDVFDEPWLDEALATYSSIMYAERNMDPQVHLDLEDYWQSRYNRLVTDGKDDLVTQSLQYFESLNDAGVYSGIVYVKGALFFKAVREEIGDDAFFTALRDYYQKDTFQIARADDLLNAFERAAGRELDDFFNRWLYSKK